MARFDFLPLTNITGKEYIGKWNGEELVLQPGETVKLEAPIAQHIAMKMAARMIMEKETKLYWEEVEKTGKKPHEVKRVIRTRGTEQAKKLIAQILWETYINYDEMTKKDLLVLAKEREVNTKDENWKELKKDDLIKRLNNA